MATAGQAPVPCSSPSDPIHPQGIPAGFDEGRLRIEFARTPADVERIQRLRYQVFNLELGEGLAAAHETGLDSDRYDPRCHHLMVLERDSGSVIGTYRLQTQPMTKELGWYCDEEFDLATLPREVFELGIELGRACIARQHRNSQGLFALWRGLAAYIAHNRKRFLFGCSSLTSQDPDEGIAVLRYLEREGHMHPTIRIDPRAATDCQRLADPRKDPAKTAVEVPKLFGTYLRYGAKICGAPAIDHAFKTIDYFMVMDVSHLHPRMRALFFAGLEG